MTPEQYIARAAFGSLCGASLAALLTFSIPALAALIERISS